MLLSLRVQVLVAVLAGLFTVTTSSRVLELSDRFLDIAKEGQWLIMFYAPWCGHCKRLEPVWAHVAQSLHNTNVRVGRVDCTRFTTMAHEFKVGGFPTIMFLKGPTRFTFNGDRTKEDIMNFATRVAGPPVQHITRPESLDNLKARNALFFVYVGARDGPLWTTYSEIAERFQPHGFFYSAAEDLAGAHFELGALPAVLVYKEGAHYLFEGEAVTVDPDPEPSRLNASLYDWINAERFGTFPKVTRGNLHQLVETRKNLVLAVVEENKLQEVSSEMADFRDMVESVIIKNRDKFHRWFQFGWVGSPELANSIAMYVVPLPYLLVVNSTTNHHHIPEDDPAQLTPEAVAMFLESVHNDSATAYGGNTLPVRAYRTFFYMRTSLGDMWQGNPVLTALLFGLPLGFLSLICYSIFCADIMDAEEEEEEDEDSGHEKRE